MDWAKCTGVVTGLQSLAKKGCLKSNRKLITVLDRKGLEKIAGPFYGTPEAEYRRLMGEAAGAYERSTYPSWISAKSTS